MTKLLTGLNSLAYQGVNAPTPPNSVAVNRAPTMQDYASFNIGDNWVDTATNDVWILVDKAARVATWLRFAGAPGVVLSVNAGNSISITGTAANPIVNVAGTIDHAVQVGNALNALSNLPLGNAGQILTSSGAGADPTWQNPGAIPGVLSTLTGNTGGAVPPFLGNINVVGDGVSITIVGNPGTNTLTASVIGTGVLTALHPDIGGNVAPIAGVINIHNTDTNVVTSNGGANNLNVNLANNILITGGYISTPGTSATGAGSASLNGSAITIENDSNDTVAPRFEFIKTRALAIVHANDFTGNLTYTGFDGVNALGTAAILSQATGAIAVGNMPGNLIFQTSNGPGQVNRLTISSAGVVSINAADAAATSLVVTGGISSITSFGQAGNGTGIPLLVDNTGLLCTVASAERFKENIEDLADDSDALYNLRPVKFNYKSDESKIPQIGLIAEEVEKVLPELAVYQDNELYSVKYNDLPVLLLNELQKLNKRVKELEKALNK